MKPNKTIMTVDLEYDWGTKKTKNLEIIVPKLLDFFDDYKIKATFFVVGDLVDKFEVLIKEISKKHEIASHSFSHTNLKKLKTAEIEKEILHSKKTLENIKINVIGFRSPKFIFPKNLGYILKKHGFIYDSSVSCTFFPGRYNNLFVPQKPYFASYNLTKKGNDILELPIPNFSFLKLPFGLPFIRLLYPLSLRKPSKKYLFYLHPCEFLEIKPENESFFVKYLYGRNRGKKAWEIFENFINKLDTEFISCRDYIKIKFPNLL